MVYRQGVQQGGVQHHALRPQLRMVQADFLSADIDHRDLRRFGSRSRRARDSDMRAGAGDGQAAVDDVVLAPSGQAGLDGLRRIDAGSTAD